MPTTDYDLAARLDADATAYAALALTQAMFVALIRSGSMSRDVALAALDQIAARVAPRGALHAVAAEKLRVFGKEVAARDDLQSYPPEYTRDARQ
jgi:hypothetical protein